MAVSTPRWPSVASSSRPAMLQLCRRTPVLRDYGLAEFTRCGSPQGLVGSSPRVVLVPYDPPAVESVHFQLCRLVLRGVARALGYSVLAAGLSQDLATVIGSRVDFGDARASLGPSPHRQRWRAGCPRLSQSATVRCPPGFTFVCPVLACCWAASGGTCTFVLPLGSEVWLRHLCEGHFQARSISRAPCVRWRASWVP